MDSVQDYYAVLGVPTSASEEELRAAYRIAARRFHPDVNNSPGATAVFREINAAYELLSDRQRRIEYDQLARANGLYSPSLRLQTYYSRRFLRSMEEPQLVYALVKIMPMQEVDLAADAPMNVCLLLDRSTSMKGARLQHLKSAVHQIIEECSSQDILSVVTFSDNAEVLIPAQHPTEKRMMKALVSTIRPEGATAILSGLTQAVAQVERNRESKFVNHVILITDGRTYGDEEGCLTLAVDAHERGIGISGMGIGEDWNDHFLDALASSTGGTSTFIVSPNMASRFLHERIRSLATTYAERARLTSVPATNVELNSVMRISPNPMALAVDPQPIPLGNIDGLTPTALMFQLHVTTGSAPLGEFYMGRIDVSAEVLGSRHRVERVLQDLTITSIEHEVEEEPPAELLDALSKLVMYRLQDRAREALGMGNIEEATRRLEYLATRLLENGQEELARAALYEAQNVMHTHKLSDEGAKRLKYGTRSLLPLLGDGL